MEYEISLKLWSLDHAVEVDVLVTYEAFRFSEPYDIGERTIWRSFYELERKPLVCTLDNQPYEPTKDDLNCWSHDIEFEIHKHFEREAA